MSPLEQPLIREFSHASPPVLFFPEDDPVIPVEIDGETPPSHVKLF